MIQLGENKNYIFNVGSLGVENIQKFKLSSRKIISKKLKIKLKNKIFLVTFNDSISNDVPIENIVKSFLEILDYFKDTTVICTLPNSDLGSSKIEKILKKF